MSTETRHPRGIYTLFFTEMWERTSFYGMRALLMLFMVDAVRGGMGLKEEKAAAIYGLYTALVYIAALPGGWMGDRLLGAKSAVWWGGVVIAIGHLVLGIGAVTTFYLGLVIVALGSGLLKSNMSTLVSQLYPEGGVRRDTGFSLFYMGINVGAFIGPLVCGYLGEVIGWRWGFSAAAAGMILGLIQFRLSGPLLGAIGQRVEHPGQNRTRDWLIFFGGLTLIVVLVGLGLSGVIKLDPQWLAKQSALVIIGIAVLFFGWVLVFGGIDAAAKKRVLVIAVLVASSAVFWSGFEQVGSSFSLFAKRYTQRMVMGWEIPAGWFQSINPLLVIGMAPLVALLWLGMARRGREPLLVTKFAWGLLLLAAGFVVAAIAATRALATGPVWPTWLISIYLLHTIGELFLSPVGLSAVTKLAPQRLVGQMMGIWFLGTSLGNLLAGLLAGEVTGDAAAQMPARFMEVVFTAGSAGLLLWLCARWIKRLMPGIQ